MWKSILLGIAAVIAILAIVVIMQPDDFRVSRTATIPAPPAQVFEYINDLKKWNEWSPWAKLDPNVKNTFEGPATGVGSVFAWAGNAEVGEGKMTITESRPNELVRLKLEFFKPFAGVSTTEYILKPEGNQTVLTWTMLGENKFIGKAMSLVMDCDKMMGGYFEKGLENLKGIVASPAKS